MSEERILSACPDAHGCTVVSTEVGGQIVRDVLRAPHTAAAPPRSARVIPEAALDARPTTEVRTFLMRQRHRARTATV